MSPVRIDPAAYRTYAATQAAQPQREEEEQRVRDELFPKEPAPDRVELKKPWEEEYEGVLAMLRKLSEKPKQNSFGIVAAKPRDPSGQLTRKLVAAGGQVEVRQLVAEAGGALVRLRVYAATASGSDAASARAAVRRLEKLLARANRKIKDLDGEDLLKVRSARAQKERQQKRADRIKDELRMKRVKRMIREHGYLREPKGADFRYPWEKDESVCESDPVVEAEIAFQAEAIAAAQTAAGDAGDAAAGEAGGAEGSAAEGGGEGA